MKLGLYWRYATRSLARGGQRTLLAIFCVAVGVMAIVGLQLVSLSVNAALLGNIAQANGGDLRLRALPVAPVRTADLARFADLQHAGQITGYATSYDAGGDIALPSGEQIDGNLLAVSPDFPLVGQPHFTLPDAGMTLPHALADNGIAVSSDIFDGLHMRIGDAVQLKVEDGRSLNARLAAVFVTSGALGPNEIVVAQATLNAAPGPSGAPLPPTFTTVYMTAPAANLSGVVAQLKQQFPAARIITAPDLLRQRQRQVDQLRLFLHLVGLLALFIGGVGIINTMQVMLRRRQIEIAMLKAAGYRQGDLNALFGLEAALLGIMGGVIGAGAGVGASYLVRTVMARAFFLDLPVILDPMTVVSGVVVGLVTALIFGLLPIVRASSEPPLAVLREARENMERRPWLASAGLLILLSLLFVAFAAAILGDPLVAVLTVYGGALIVFGLGLCFSLLILAIARLPVYERPRGRMALWIFGAIGACGVATVAAALLAALGGVMLRILGGGIPGIVALVLLGGLGIILVGCASVYVVATLGDALIMFAPRAWKTAVMLAYRNLARQRVRTTTTLTALFVGVFGIGMVVVLGQGIKDAVHTSLADALRYNAFVLAPPVESAAIQDVLDQRHVAAVTGSITRIQPVSLPGQSDPPTVLKILGEIGDGGTLSSIEGFDLRQDIPLITLKAGGNLSVGDVGSNRVVVASRLMDAPIGLRVGDQIGVQSADGSVKRVLVIVGFYDSRAAAGNPNFGAVLADKGIVDEIGGAQRLTIFSMKLTPQTVAPLRRQINQTVPAAILFSIVDISALIDQIINNLILMLTTIASLAMLAGLIIIANAVALAMLERRREIGILKSVGHTSASVLATILIENGLIGLLGALVAMLLVTGAIIALSTLVLKLALSVGSGLIVAIIMATVAVTMLVALLVAWNATRIRPIEVLRYE